MKRIMLVLTAIVMVAGMMALGAMSSFAQDGALDTGGDQYEEDDGALDTGGGSDDDSDDSPADPQCGWYYMTHSSYDPWWEYWCWWPGWGWEFVFWLWA